MSVPTHASHASQSAPHAPHLVSALCFVFAQLPEEQTQKSNDELIAFASAYCSTKNYNSSTVASMPKRLGLAELPVCGHQCLSPPPLPSKALKEHAKLLGLHK
jgi:hypothetical protein